MSQAPVTIGMPIFNGARFLEQTLKSILSQTFSDFVLLISDNGSTDATEEICREFGQQDSRVDYRRFHSNRGAAWNYNNVFRISESDYFKWAADDDLCEPTWLATCIAALENNSDAVLAFTQVPHIDEEGQLISEPAYVPEVAAPRAHIRFRSLILNYHDSRPVFGLIRSGVLQRTSLIGAFEASDYALLAELALLGRFVQIEQPLQFRRIYSSASERCWRGKHRERTGWYSPEYRGRPTLPEWSLGRGYLRAIRRYSPDLRTSLSCSVEMLRWLRWGHGRLMLADLGYVFTGRHRQARGASARTPG